MCSKLTETYQRFERRSTLLALLAGYVAALVGFGSAVWFEWPAPLRLGLLAATSIIAVLAAICVGRVVTRAQGSMTFRELPSFSGRGAGVLAFIALASLAIACAKLISPRSWPGSVDAALTMLDAQIDAASRNKLAHMGYDELIELHQGWGQSIRDRFGMWSGNDELLEDCDPQYTHPDMCSTVIISRYWKKVRAELPPAERLPLEALESKLERVRLKPHEFKEQPLRDVVAFFNDAIRAQLAADAQFTIRFDPVDADEPVSVAWHETVPISLREALALMAASPQLNVRKTPPDMLIERE